MRLSPPNAYYEPYLVNTITSQKTLNVHLTAHTWKIKIRITNIQILNNRPFSSQLSGGFLCVKNINIYGIMLI